MMDSVIFGPESTKHLLNEILQWGNAAKSLQDDTLRYMSASGSKGKVPFTKQSLLPFAAPKPA